MIRIFCRRDYKKVAFLWVKWLVCLNSTIRVKEMYFKIEGR